MANSNFDVSLEQPGGLERRLTIRVPNADIEREVEARLTKVGRTARLKGFRPGKIPKKVVRKQFGPQVRQEVLSEVIRDRYTRAIQENELRPAAGPRIEPVSEEVEGQEQEHFTFRATFEVLPEIELAGLDTLEITRPTVEISEADVDRMIEKLREQRAEWREASRPSQNGDRVVVDFVGTLDGEKFEGGEASEVTIAVGGGQVIEDFDKALVGLSAGDSKKADVQFPEDYPAENLAGRKVEFEITAHRVEEKVLPEVDEQFAALFGVTDGGVEKLREDVRANMQRELNERLKNERKTAAFDALLKANEVTTPRSMVDEEIRALQADAMQRMGIEDPSKAPPAERFEAAAQRRIAVGLLLQEVLRSNGIELDRSRVTQRVEELAAPYEDPQQAAQLYRGSREMMAQIESSVLEDQVAEFLLEQAKVTDDPKSFEEFMGAGA